MCFQEGLVTQLGSFSPCLGLGWRPGQCPVVVVVQGAHRASSSSLEVQGSFFPVRLKERVQFTKYAPVQI